MAELIYPTNEMLRGPWLIDREGLEAFDRTVEQEWQRISAYNENKKKEEFERRVQQTIQVYQEEGREITIEEARKKQERFQKERPYFASIYETRSKRKINIELKGKRIEVDSFMEAFRHPELLNEIPKKFDARVECGEIDCTITLSGNLLSLRASPENSSEAREVYVSLNQWAASVAPPKWLHWWKKLNGLQWILWIAMIFLIVFTMGRDPKEDAKKDFQNQAQQILRSGLTPDQQLKAIEIILALQSEYVPSSQPAKNPGWFLLLVFGGFGMCVVSSIVPSAVLGIGRGQDRIAFWRKWIWFVFIAVPGFILVNIIWPYIARAY